MEQSTEKLKKESNKLRLYEFVAKGLGAIAIGVGAVTTAGMAGDAARSGFENIQDNEIFGNAWVLGIGTFSMSLSSSLGRKADVIDVELLRRDAPAGAPPPPDLPTETSSQVA